MAYAHIWEIPDQTVYAGGDLYDKYDNLKFFADVDGLADKALGGSDVPVAVSGHSRQHFMRDPAPTTVAATTRQTYQGVRQTKGAIPGVTVTLESGVQRRQFQWTGTMAALYNWLKSAAEVPINLYGPTGAPYDPIPVATVVAGRGVDVVR